MYKDINNKTGFTNLQGNNFLYGNMKLLNTTEKNAALADGIVEWNPTPTTAAPTIEQQLQTAKNSKKNKIRTGFGYYTSLPVVVNTVSWVGGFDSVIKLDAAKRLAESVSAVNVTFYDVDNQPHVLTINEATTIIHLVATDYQTALATKNSLYNDVINAIDLVAVDNISIPVSWEQPTEDI